MDAQHLRYIIDHVFTPVKLPQDGDYTVACEATLASSVLQSAMDFQSLLSPDGSQQWDPMVKLLCDLRDAAEIQSLRPELIERQIANMNNGGVIAYYIRAQNAAIIIRNLSHETVLESFEVSPMSAAVVETKGKLLCSYPGPAIAISHDVINDSSFRESLANFLYRMNEDILDAAPMTQKAKSHVVEERDTSHPRYITEFLTGMLRGMGTEADVPRIRKRVGDNVLWNNAKLPWRRSPLWLVIRVALQTSLHRRSSLYKLFMVFFLAQIILTALDRGQSNDLLFCMRAKMSRRLYKLGSAAPNVLKRLVSEVAGKVECRMTEIWTSVQSHAVHSVFPYRKPNELNLTGDTHLSLTNSRAYLSRVLAQSLPTVSTSSFQPHHSPRLTTFAQFISNDRSKLSEACQSNPHLTLADFEACVEKSLSDWLRVVVDVNSACLAVADCMDQYWDSRGIYAGNPENMSLMFLTLLELWVALDQLALRDCSLLHEYSPEIPEALFEVLLLRKSSDLVRLKLAIQYLRVRHRQAMRSIFTDNVDRDTFAVRFCAMSEIHRQLKLRIENQAVCDKEAKVRELGEKNELYQRLMQELRYASHTYVYNHRGQSIHADWYECGRCILENRIGALNIDVFEWPLPANTLMADVVVFELQCPTAYNAWRTATYIFLHDMCTPPQHSASNTANASTLLAEYQPLRPYWIQPRNAHVILASETKSFLSSHYRNTRIPSNEGQVCVNNGLQFRLFDCSNSSWATNAFTKCDLASHCTFTLPPGPYQCLQYAVAGTSHTSNDIIANQIDCSKDLTLHEFMSFGVLRSGPLLQWLNILRELRANTLTFRREEVHALLMQAAWQVGPLSQDGDPEWHVELANAKFGSALLSELQDLLLGVEANWQEVMMVRMVIALVCRLLASTSDGEVVRRAFGLLQEARRVAFGWLQELSKKVQESDDNEVKEFQDRVCEMAAVCRSTFDVDSRHVPDRMEALIAIFLALDGVVTTVFQIWLHSLRILLFTQLLLSAFNVLPWEFHVCSLYGAVLEEDVALIVECAVVLHDNRPPNDTSLPSHLRILLDRDRRAARSFEPHLLEHILRDRAGLDMAISAIWSAYRPGTSWRQLQHPNERWLASQTAESVAQMSQIVHYDLLGGELLINGQPLGRLPSNILASPLYGLIFGSKVLDIVPGSMSGTEYATRGEIDGYQFHFSFRSGTELVIRATQGDMVLELVPRERFIGDLPHTFVHDHIHWLDIKSGVVELRPTIDKWNSSSTNWHIYFSLNGHSFMRRGDATLVDIRSGTYEMLATRLEPLESKDRITISCRGEQPDVTVSVDMPRFGLSFFVNKDNELQSRNMRNMVVDSNQSTGTMIGLHNQLVLRPADPISMFLPRARCVIIPVGSISFSQTNHHVSVEIDTGSDSRVQFQQYRIDDTLGRLVGNVSLANKLYKIYLHALTSHCLPDPLTGRTGTEEALHDLHSAGCWSFQSLTHMEEDLLEKIGSLTPIRQCYPEHLRVMQQTIWSDLSPLSQHHEYYSVTRAILEYADRLRVFTEDAKVSSPISRLDSSLLERAALRNCVYYPAEFAYPPSNAADVEYHSRDQFTDTGTINESAVYNTARTVYEWPQRLNTCCEIFDKLRVWNSIAGPGTNSGLTLQYGSHWLKMDMANAWLSLYNLCRFSERHRDRYPLVFVLSALTYASPQYRDLTDTLLAFATCSRFRALSSPDFDSYLLSDGCEPNEERLQQIIEDATHPFEETPEATLPRGGWESDIELARRRYSTYEKQCRIRQSNFVQSLIDQWPCDKPGRPSGSYRTRFDIVEAMKEAGATFGSWYRNRALRDHVSQVETILRQVHSATPHIRNPSPYQFVPCLEHRRSSTTVIPINVLFTWREVTNIDGSPPTLPTAGHIGQERLHGCGEVRSLVSEFQNGELVFHRTYGNNLAESQRTLDQETVDTYPEDIPFTSKYLADHYTQCKDHLDRVVGAIVRSLSPSSTLEEIMFTTCLWPRLTITSLLHSLGSLSGINLTAEWKRALTSLANAVISIQRAQRLLGFTLGNQRDEFFKELKNTNCDGWDPSLYPDWLLVQIDGHFIVRSIQADVALEMISPTSGENTALQLNMGEGKSSVIVPVIAATLADRTRLVRVVVLKSLANSMFQMLVDRLGGLTNRRIFYMPFSRAINPDVDQVRVIQNLYEECMRVGGILVTQPDHILSFKLMAIDRQLSANDAASRPVTDKLLESQRWLEKNTRDILDESDEILHVRFQLVYTVGLQRHLEDHPDRWTTVEQVFTLVKKLIPEVYKSFPLGVELQTGQSGTLPFIRILVSDAGVSLVSLIAENIVKGALANYTLGQLDSQMQDAVLCFITELEAADTTVQKVRVYCGDSTLWKGLLLLRGLLAHGILVYVLKEWRWRVDYGLDPRRSMLAVPYRAKDIPALRAEFGHPDVAVALTCLSYYYGGLQEHQIDLCFTLLYKLDNPTLEYETWIQGCDDVPESLRQLNGVNLRSLEQRQQHLLPLFRRNVAVINFFLSHVVFPKEAKEFLQKQVASGWDIAEKKDHVTTGFSGTNDNRYLLPMSITQRDPPHQLCTNAKVLNYLLRPENSSYTCAQDVHGECLSAQKFLALLVQQKPEIRVLLDVGAEMLELQNDALVTQWLALNQDAQAAIFFGDNDQLMVLTRDGTVESFVSSPFNQQLDQCILYLDDAHTRGTDVKLPRDVRAAVTLGPKVTKDRLVQGCMRMRKLGNGHSVMFFAPLEIDRSIRKAAKKTESDAVEVIDILQWVMLETCLDIQHRAHQWAEQGFDHGNRASAWSKFCGGKISSDGLASSWLQREAKSLEEMYGLNPPREHPAFEVVELRQRCMELGVMSLSESRMDEEQEREVDHEVEREQEVERPPKAKAATHRVHAHIKAFIRTGTLPLLSPAIVPAFSNLAAPAAVQHSGAWSSRLLASVDFSTTIERQMIHKADDHLRPVNWILSCVVEGRMTLVILSPYEVNELLPSIRCSTKVQLHIYTPRVTHAMKPCDDLTLYCISSPRNFWMPPPALRMQLNIFAGQLYLPDYETYRQFAEFLGVYTTQMTGVKIQSDGFILPKDRPAETKARSPFKTTPLPFLKELLGLRRKGMRYSDTHVGKVLRARLLTDADFDNA